jgi:hypothetical protein
MSLANIQVGWSPTLGNCWTDMEYSMNPVIFAQRELNLKNNVEWTEMLNLTFATQIAEKITQV